VLKCEFGDKTFLLLILFCVIWQKDEKDDENTPIHRNNYFMGLRLLIFSNIGISIVTGMNILKTKNIYAYQSGFIVAVVLMIALCMYMYSICQKFLDKLITDEKSGHTSHDKVEQNLRRKDIIKKLKDDQKKIVEIRKEQMNITIAAGGVNQMLNIFDKNPDKVKAL
jgi:uncharacterized membrane protein